MAINNLDSNFDSKSWSVENCNTTYLGERNLMKCDCFDDIGPFYFSIVTDLSRILVPDGDICVGGVCVNLQDFEKIALAILVLLIFYLIAMPLIAISKDRKDYKLIKKEIEEIDEELIKKIALFRQ